MDEHLIKQLHLITTGDQTSTKLAKHRKVKARIAQFERKSILPINTLLNCLCGLSIGQSFNELEPTSQSETPRSFSGLPTGREQRGKLRVLIHSAELVTNLHV